MLEENEIREFKGKDGRTFVSFDTSTRVKEGGKTKEQKISGTKELTHEEHTMLVQALDALGWEHIPTSDLNKSSRKALTNGELPAEWKKQLNEIVQDCMLTSA